MPPTAPGHLVGYVDEGRHRFEVGLEPLAQRAGEGFVLRLQREVHEGPLPLPDIDVTLVGGGSRVPRVTARLRATWVPHLARRYRRSHGPWDVPTLDALISAGGGEVVDGDARLDAGAMEDLVARVAGGLRARGVKKGESVAWQLPNCLARRRPDPRLLAHRGRGDSGPALLRAGRRRAGIGPGRPGPRG